MTDEDVWFEPKRFGYGAGLPIKWQGWALTLGYASVVIVASATLAQRHRSLFLVLVTLSTLPLLVVAARHTRGGWRWRWGGKA